MIDEMLNVIIMCCTCLRSSKVLKKSCMNLSTSYLLTFVLSFLFECRIICELWKIVSIVSKN